MRTLKDYAEITSKLRKFKTYKDTQGKACCPAHDDQHPSMTVGIGDDGRLLVSCKSGGCSFERIADALGVKPADFFPPGERVGTRGDPTRRSQIVASYAYERPGPDPAELETVCEVVKLLTKAGNVQTRIRTPNHRFRTNAPPSDENPEWVWSAQHPPCLYRHADINATRRVFLVDTEDDANALWDVGLQGTTVPLGLAAFGQEAAGLLTGYSVTILPSGDAYGGEGDDSPHADRARSAAKLLLGKAATVQVCFLPDLPRGAGFSNWRGQITSGPPEQEDERAKDLQDAFRRHVKNSAVITTLADAAAIKPPVTVEHENMLAYLGTIIETLTPERKARLAELLNLPASSFDALEGLGYDTHQHCWTFPERGSEGQLIGASRRWSNGAKANVDASRRGLTIPKGFDPADPNDKRPIIVVEGASDTLACHHAGLRAIGRPSNNGGGQLLLSLLSRCPTGTEVIVFGENDKRERDGKTEHPGLDGARKIAEDLQPLKERGVKIDILMPPDGFKDAREFLTARTEPWDQRGRTFLQRSGHAGTPATATEIKRPITDRIGELVAFYRRQPPKHDPVAEAERYDALAVRISGKAESTEEETETLLVEICAELIHRHETAVRARKER